MSNRISDDHKFPVDEDMQYAVFVSYVEIYNNYTRDLLVTITSLAGKF